MEKIPIVESEPVVVRHTLEMEEEEKIEQSKPGKDEVELIPTTNYIKNFNVFYEEVVPEGIEDDFVIIEAKSVLNDIEVIDPEVVTEKTEEDQFALTFDMPLSGTTEQNEEKAQTITFDLDDNLKDIDVKDYVEVNPVLEFNKEGETRYNLEEYMELETKLTGARSVAETHEPKLMEDELVFEKKTLDTEASTGGENNANVDPFNSSINDLLKDRADERRRKLKNFNYKFQNNRNSIDEIEKQPAYKRQGVDLNDVPQEQKVSRTTLSEDSNDEIQLRSNNSFLHDNVD
ncbi:MAG: hypothetical protein ABJU26_10470 [Flavobacteriaceae bacterium]